MKFLLQRAADAAFHEISVGFELERRHVLSPNLDEVVIRALGCPQCAAVCPIDPPKLIAEVSVQLLKVQRD